LSAWQTLVEYWRSRNVVSVFSRFHPLLGNPAVHLTGASEQGRTVAIDVARPMDEIRNDYRRQVRQQLRRCSEVNLKVSHDPGWEHLDDFVRLYYETMIRNRALPYYLFPEEYFRRLRKVLGERGSLMVATFDGEAASIALVIEYRRIVNVHLLGNSERFYKYAPSKMLFDEIAQWAQLRGAHFVHLGGGRGCNSDDPLFRFKAQFSRYSFPFYLAKLILNNEAYEARVAERKHESEAWGVEMTPDFFPAYRSPVQPPRILNETA